MMKILCAALSLMLLSVSAPAPAEESIGHDPGHTVQNEPATAPYLLPNAPTFDLTLVKFRARYNQDNPALPIGEYRAISLSGEETSITRAAVKIDETLYSSVALEKGTGKIKSLQLTYLSPGDDDKSSRTLAVNYMAAVMREFATAMTPEQSVAKVMKLLEAGKGRRYFSVTDGALRYVVSDNGEKGVTFAVEPIKLSLSGNAG